MGRVVSFAVAYCCSSTNNTHIKTLRFTKWLRQGSEMGVDEKLLAGDARGVRRGVSLVRIKKKKKNLSCVTVSPSGWRYNVTPHEDSTAAQLI